MEESTNAITETSRRVGGIGYCGHAVCRLIEVHSKAKESQGSVIINIVLHLYSNTGP